MAELLRHLQRKRGATDKLDLQARRPGLTLLARWPGDFLDGRTRPAYLLTISNEFPRESPMRESELLARITIDPEQCGGRPCIRGMRIRVIDVLELLAAGESPEVILAEYPYLEPDDIAASLLYAARQLDHPVLAA